MTGGEKRVDTQLSSDMVKTALNNKSSPFNTLIAVGTGDLDLLPPTDIIINETNFHIEVWSWKQSLSSTILQYSRDHNKQMTVNYLDSHRTAITFKELVKHKPSHYCTVKFVLTLAQRLGIEELNTSIERTSQ